MDNTYPVTLPSLEGRIEALTAILDMRTSIIIRVPTRWAGQKCIEQKKQKPSSETILLTRQLRSQPFNSDSQTPHSVSNASTSSASDQFLQSQRAITKMARLKEILSKYYPPNEVQKTLSEIWICCLGKRDYSLADTALNIFNAVDEFRKSMDHPGKT